MPDATMVKITIKSMRAARLISSQHNPSHRSVDELDVLDLGNGLGHAVGLCYHASHHVDSAVISQRDKGVIITHAFFLV